MQSSSTDRKVTFMGTVTMENGTTETVINCDIPFPAGESQDEFDTRIKNCRGLCAKADELGVDLKIKGDRGIISQFVALAPARTPSNTMKFTISGIDRPIPTSGRLDLGGGVSARFDVTK